MESLYLLFLAVFFVIFVFPLTFEIKVSFDFLENRGSLSIRLWPFKFKVSRIKRKGKNILLIQKKKNQEINVKFGEKQLRFLAFFKNEVGNKLKLRKINVYSKVGTTNPFASSIFSSIVANGFLIFLTRIKTLQPSSSFLFRNKTVYNDNKLAFAVSSRVAISCFDLLFSFLVSILRSKKDVLVPKVKIPNKKSNFKQNI